MSLENIPKDPVMLMSFMNMKLRDHYSSLEALSDDMDISESELIVAKHRNGIRQLRFLYVPIT